MYDLLIKRARIAGAANTADIAVENGRIAKIGADIDESSAKKVILAEGRLVSPGFVDSHTHFDKALSLGKKESPTLQQAVDNFTEYMSSMSKAEIKEDVKKRATKVARMCAAGGSTTIRTHSNVEDAIGLAGMEALNEVKENLRDFIDIKITALPSFYGDGAVCKRRFEQLEQAAAAGLMDFVGGAMHLHENWAELTEKLFAFAAKHDLPIDFHVDEHDHPDVGNFMQVAKLTKEYGYEGRVSCGHVTALCAVDDATASEAIRLAVDAKLNIITLPSCNLYLMGRTDKQPIRRGVTRIREFLDAGVNISYASDNIRDPFRPIGNGDMLEEGLITAQVAQMVTASELEKVFAMGTINPAKALMLEDYGLEEGKKADLVVFDSETVAQALTSQSAKRHVVKNGKIVAETVKETSVAF